MIIYIVAPYEEVSGDQHNRKIDCDLGLKIEWLEECSGIGDYKKENGWKISGQKFIGNSPLEYNFHLEAR